MNSVFRSISPRTSPLGSGVRPGEGRARELGAGRPHVGLCNTNTNPCRMRVMVSSTPLLQRITGITLDCLCFIWQRISLSLHIDRYHQSIHQSFSSPYYVGVLFQFQSFRSQLMAHVLRCLECPAEDVASLDFGYVARIADQT
jgi:hypothetical protein